MSSLRRFAQICEAVAATAKKSEKVRLVAAYLASLGVEDAARAALFLTGRAFPRAEEQVLAVGGSLIWQAVGKLSGASPQRLEQIYRKHGDLGAMAEEVLRGREASQDLALAGVADAFKEISRQRRLATQLAVLEGLLERAGPLEVKYLIKIMTGDLRIGLKESLVEEAVAEAFGQPPEQVRRANMLAGDIGGTLRMAAVGRLAEVRLRLFHPVDFMLASPAENAVEAAAAFPEGFLVEDKYDGVRAQVHKTGDGVKVYSRTLDEMVEFPELLEPLAALAGEFVLDGEIVAWRGGRALPFTRLQHRLGHRQPDLFLPEAVPVRFVAFDLLYQDGELLLDHPLQERRGRLERLLAGAAEDRVLPAPARHCAGEEGLHEAFDEALARGNEGVMAKAPQSPYTPGRRGRFWLKLKKPLATLDVVVTAVEYGHGKRRGLLSDYTFAVRDGKRLVNLGKAYSGLTDEEIRRYTAHFLEHTVEDQGFRRVVEPAVVLEVAFNNIQRSERHESGYALRFPRIVRIREDRRVGEIDTIERVRELHARQQAGRRSG